MALLITPAEVLETAFPATEQFRDDLIRPTMIEVAQLQYLQPVFGTLFDALEEERYSDFVSTYIKPPLAYYIRCMVIDELTASVGTLGIPAGEIGLRFTGLRSACRSASEGRPGQLQSVYWIVLSESSKPTPNRSPNTTRNRTCAIVCFSREVLFFKIFNYT